jgi:hypothetical protein
VTKKSTESVAASRPTWETLEAIARHATQQFLQHVLEAEVDELLARGGMSDVVQSRPRSAIATALANRAG